MSCPILLYCFFFFNDTATTEIYTLSLHDALPISVHGLCAEAHRQQGRPARAAQRCMGLRSEEHTSELQSHSDLVCRLLLEKKKERSPQAAPRTRKSACATRRGTSCRSARTTVRSR